MFWVRTARELSENHPDLQVWQDTAAQGSEQIQHTGEQVLAPAHKTLARRSAERAT